ncbi:MAG TPA: hypothetical protein VFO10_17715 [Oligoflexus sp.]|uniref:hypothetical protein n=1 Tax=Oligoflexus sp. TaxID=1971216 RepID=UPI002D7FF84E|nr:hypothetical protein [Oligoflexus sp.]HET9239101.1 hypothetical protein [Oligoflexus sp.]
MDAHPVAPIESAAPTTRLPVLYAPGLPKFIVMNITTFGLYTIYWGYRNWKLMRVAERTFAWAPLCALFLPLTLRSLLDKTENERVALSVSNRQLTVLAILFFALNVMSHIPGYGEVISLFAFVPLIFVNQYFGRINRLNQHDAAEIERFSVGNLVFAILGSLLIALALWGLSSVQEAPQQDSVPAATTRKKI